MQDLYPIIRRKRRPLLVADAPPVAIGNVEPVKAEAEDVTTVSPIRGRSARADDTPGCIAASSNPIVAPT